jgi:hypothetical protein
MFFHTSCIHKKSREQLEARRVIPTMTQDELIRKWGNVVEK